VLGQKPIPTPHPHTKLASQFASHFARSTSYRASAGRGGVCPASAGQRADVSAVVPA